ncbi:MAG: Asp23/Gls24 family envelope stress response protein, partial [Christensenellaceae bacterium]|nr:Asp23/Gls24 family envelope stress response protein [Christensenellaceae bacterium]
MSAILETKRGKIIYSDDYIGTIAGLATTECYGVVGMSSKKVTDGFVELLGKDNLKRGVKIFSD